jgi:hypothetical protein
MSLELKTQDSRQGGHIRGLKSCVSRLFPHIPRAFPAYAGMPLRLGGSEKCTISLWVYESLGLKTYRPIDL